MNLGSKITKEYSEAEMRVKWCAVRGEMGDRR